MIVVDLMVIFASTYSFVFVSFCFWVATYHCILVILIISVLILIHATLLTFSDLPVLYIISPVSNFLALLISAGCNGNFRHPT